MDVKYDNYSCCSYIGEHTGLDVVDIKSYTGFRSPGTWFDKKYFSSPVNTFRATTKQWRRVGQNNLKTKQETNSTCYLTLRSALTSSLRSSVCSLRDLQITAEDRLFYIMLAIAIERLLQVQLSTDVNYAVIAQSGVVQLGCGQTCQSSRQSNRRPMKVVVCRAIVPKMWYK